MDKKESTKSVDKKTIGKRITELRKKKGLSMNQLAKNIGIAQSRITCYESDAQIPGIEALKDIAAALGVSLAHLVYGEDISDFQKLVPILERLPQDVKNKILDYVKDQIRLVRHQGLDIELWKELE